RHPGAGTRPTGGRPRIHGTEGDPVSFSRRRGNAGKHAAAERRRGGPRHAVGRRGREEPDALAAATAFGEDDGYDDGDQPVAQGPGPYDADEAVPDVPRLDLGSLL